MCLFWSIFSSLYFIILLYIYKRNDIYIYIYQVVHYCLDIFNNFSIFTINIIINNLGILKIIETIRET